MSVPPRPARTGATRVPAPLLRRSPSRPLIARPDAARPVSPAPAGHPSRSATDTGARAYGRPPARARVRPLPAVAPVALPTRLPGLRTLRTSGAAVLAYVLAQRLGTSPQPLLAALTALLVAQLTAYETIFSGLERIVSVLTGVLVAVALASMVGLTWWSLGGAVALSLVLARLMHLGSNSLEVPISAMIVLAVGGDPTLATDRVVETLLGAAVGVGVTLLVAPPLNVRPAADALGELADRTAEVLDGLAGDLRLDWSRAAADRWLGRARGLSDVVQRADRTLARAEESTRLNPRAAVTSDVSPRLRVALSGMEHAYVALRSLARAVRDCTHDAADETVSYDGPARAALASVLDEAAGAFRAVGAQARTGHPRDELADRLRALQAARARLGGLLVVDPARDPAAWQQHGALLAGIDRLHVELEAAVAPAEPRAPGRLVLPRRRRVLRAARPR